MCIAIGFTTAAPAKNEPGNKSNSQYAGKAVIGARFGVEMMLSLYSGKDGIKPWSTGARAYFSIRYQL